MMKRIMDNEFKTEHQVTIGVEFGSFAIKIENKVVKLQIWDTVRLENLNVSLGWLRVIQISDKNFLQRSSLCVFDI